MLLAIYAPFMQVILNVQALSLGDWSIVVAISFWAVMMTELVKFFNRLGDKERDF
jgi:hypothetical protein